LRLKDSCITQLKAQGPSRTCNESKEEEEEEQVLGSAFGLWVWGLIRPDGGQGLEMRDSGWGVGDLVAG